ncbi:MAG: hypothetical protein U0Y68_14175 [Blastocatellia bacterium]
MAAIGIGHGSASNASVGFVMVTFAPATAALLESSIVPTIEPVTACPQASDELEEEQN